MKTVVGKSKCAALMPRCVISDMLKRLEWWSEEGDGASALQSGHQRYNRDGMNTIVIRSRESITPLQTFRHTFISKYTKRMLTFPVAVRAVFRQDLRD